MSKTANPVKEKAIYDFVVAFKKAHDGNSPTHREICEGAGISTTSMVAFYLRRLEDQGKLAVGGYQSRHITVTGGQWSMGGHNG